MASVPSPIFPLETNAEARELKSRQIEWNFVEIDQQQHTFDMAMLLLSNGNRRRANEQVIKKLGVTVPFFCSKEALVTLSNPSHYCSVHLYDHLYLLIVVAIMEWLKKGTLMAVDEMMMTMVLWWWVVVVVVVVG